MMGAFVDHADGPLFYDVAGEGPFPDEPLIFLHGLGVTHEMWGGWVPVLSPHFRLVRIGLRGHGQSVGMRGSESWTLDDLSDDILAVADHAGVETFHVVGESLGGTAVLNLATRGQDRVLSATAVSAAHRGGQIEGVRSWRDHIEGHGMADWSEQMMPRRFMDGALSSEQHHWFHAIQSEIPAEPLLHMAEILLRTDLTPELSDITCPLLLLSPDQSPFVPLDIPEEIKRHVPAAELCVLTDARHGIFYSHAEPCALRLLSFLEQHK